MDKRKYFHGAFTPSSHFSIPRSKPNGVVYEWWRATLPTSWPSTGWSPVTLILITFHCLPVRNAIQWKLLVITRPASHCQGPDGISDEMQPSEPVCARLTQFSSIQHLAMNGGQAAGPIEHRRRSFRICTQNEQMEDDGWHNTSRASQTDLTLVVSCFWCLLTFGGTVHSRMCLQMVQSKQFYFIILEITQSDEGLANV